MLKALLLYVESMMYTNEKQEYTALRPFFNN